MWFASKALIRTAGCMEVQGRKTLVFHRVSRPEKARLLSWEAGRQTSCWVSSRFAVPHLRVQQPYFFGDGFQFCGSVVANTSGRISATVASLRRALLGPDDGGFQGLNHVLTLIQAGHGVDVKIHTQAVTELIAAVKGVRDGTPPRRFRRATGHQCRPRS